MPSEYSSQRSASISSCARVEAAEGNFDALHAGGVPHGAGAFGGDGGVVDGASGFAVRALAVVITLAVGAAAKARFGEDAVFDFALLAKSDFVFEDVDFGGEVLGDAVRRVAFSTVNCWFSSKHP